MSDGSQKTGQCMCGAVSFTARNVPSAFGACHCEMCRRWTGSALLGVTVPEGDVTWTGQENIGQIQSSSWAERTFCKACGTGLSFRVTDGGEFGGDVELPIGLFDDANGFTFSNEIYIDHKPDSFAYAGAGRKTMTRQDCIDKFSKLDEA